jgi:hypothetical protein
MLNSLRWSAALAAALAALVGAPSSALAYGASSPVLQVTDIEIVDATSVQGTTQAAAIGGTKARAIGGTRARAIGGTKARAIGGTRARAIGGTKARAIGGTRARAIGGTKARAIGGTRARAIGGTKARAIGGTRARAIGGTRARAIGGTKLRAIGGTRTRSASGIAMAQAAIDSAAATSSAFAQIHSDAPKPNLSPTRPATPVFWGDGSYDWVVSGPASMVDTSTVSVLGIPMHLEAADASTVAAAALAGESVAVLGYADSNHVRVVPTGMTYVQGSSDVIAVGQVMTVDYDAGQATLSNGLVIDLAGLDAGSRPNLMKSDWVVTRGQYLQ